MKNYSEKNTLPAIDNGYTWKSYNKSKIFGFN